MMVARQRFQSVAPAIRVGSSRVLLKNVIRAFQDGASPESIVHRYAEFVKRRDFQW
ncbi:MAG: hypothetical protein WCD53_18165 [Microcoleus sp.]